MKTQSKHKYYKIEIPGDYMDTSSDDAIDAIFNLAIELAQERQRIYHIPAKWILLNIDKAAGIVRLRYDF